MATRGAKRWYFEPRTNGIFVIRGGREVCDKSGKNAAGAIKAINTPLTRSACNMAQNFLPYAIEVRKMGGTSFKVELLMHVRGSTIHARPI